MSWGYFLDLELAVRTSDWATLGKTTGAALRSPWWGFEEAALEDYFGSRGFEAMTCHKALGFFGKAGSIKTIIDRDGTTTVRVIALLDRGGDTQVAGPIAAMFEAASRLGGTGRIRLVNDGTYAGEDGVEVAIVDGRLVRTRLEDTRLLTEALSVAIYPELEEELDRYVAPPAKPAAKKPAARKPAAKKPAAKKPAAKKVSKKPAKKVSKKPTKQPTPRRR